MQTKIRMVVSAVVLACVLSLGGVIQQASADEEEGGKCNCWHPNTNKYGIIEGGECPAVDCWVPWPN